MRYTALIRGRYDVDACDEDQAHANLLADMECMGMYDVEVVEIEETYANE